MSRSTDNSPSIHPPPSFADFKFDVIGQPPQLLKRLGATPPPDFRHSQTPRLMDHLQYPTRSETPKSNPGSQPSLQQRLESANYAPYGLNLPMDLEDDLLEQKPIIIEPQVPQTTDSPSSPNLSSQNNNQLPLTPSCSGVPLVAAQHTGLLASSTSSSPPFQTTSLPSQAKDASTTDISSAKELRQSQAAVRLAYDCALIAFEKAERQLASAQETYDAAKATLTAINMARSHFHPALLPDIPHYHSHDNAVHASSSSSLTGDQGMAAVVAAQPTSARSDSMTGETPLRGGPTIPPIHSVSEDLVSELEREANEARLAWSLSSMSEHPLAAKTKARQAETTNGFITTSFINRTSTGTTLDSFAPSHHDPTAQLAPSGSSNSKATPFARQVVPQITTEQGRGTPRPRDNPSTNILVNKPTQSSTGSTVSPLPASHRRTRDASADSRRQSYSSHEHEGDTSSVENGTKAQGRYALKPTTLASASSLHRIHAASGDVVPVTSDAEEEQMVADDIQLTGAQDSPSLVETSGNEAEAEAEGLERGLGIQGEKPSNRHHATGSTRNTPSVQLLETSPSDMASDKRSSLRKTPPFNRRDKTTGRAPSASYAASSSQTATSHSHTMGAQMAGDVAGNKLLSPSKSSPRNSVAGGEKVSPSATSNTPQATTLGSYQGSQKTPAASSQSDGTGSSNLATGSSVSLLQRMESASSASALDNPHATPKAIPKPPSAISTPTSILGKRPAPDAPSTSPHARTFRSKKMRNLSATPDKEPIPLESRIGTGEGSAQRSGSNEMDETRHFPPSGQKPWQVASKAMFPPTPQAPALEGSQTPPSRFRATRPAHLNGGDMEGYHNDPYYHPNVDRPLTSKYSRPVIQSAPAPAYNRYDRPPGRGRGGPRLGPHHVADRLMSNSSPRPDAHGPSAPSASNRRGEQPKLFDRIDV